MMQAMGNALNCPNCGQPFQAQVNQIIDVGRDPAAKQRFLSGEANVVTCPNCGFRAGIAAPILYHDPDKELLMVHVPMELGLQKEEQERIIGSLLKNLMDSLPAEARRGYMFQPRTVLTLQGMVEQILMADGITPEMLEAQKQKARLAETFLQTDIDELDALIQQYDEQIDYEMIQFVTTAAENALQAGRQDMAQHAMEVREKLVALSTAGQEAAQLAVAQEQAIDEVVKALEGLGEQPTVQDFIDLVLRFAEDDQRLQALVGLQYPAFDYAFFQELSGRIEQVADGEKADLEALRDRLLELTNMIKQQQEAMVGAAVETLRAILSSSDLEAAVEQHLNRIDDTFLAVLTANIQAAEQNQDLMTSAKLKQIYEIVMQRIQQGAPPELQFITRLLQAESEQAAQQMMDAEAESFGPNLLPLMDALMDDVRARGEQNLLARLESLRAYLATKVE